MKRQDLDRVRQEVKVALRLVPWVLAALLLAAAVGRTDLTATAGLFQSPPEASPTPELPTALPTLTATQVATPVATDTPAATETPMEPSPTVPVASATPTPTETPPAPTETPVSTATPRTTSSPVPSETPGASDRYPEGESDVTFDLGELFDAVALGLSRLWLCCGVLVFLGLIVLFVMLWVASQRRRQQEE
jgi:hypothetical protein